MGDRWFLRYRLEWLGEIVAIYGFINREHLMKKFSISRPQASADLRTFMRQYPHAIRYDKSLKRYVADTIEVRAP